ncbi:MAG: AAA family ATPase [Chlamydiae bacterium]|nr:AAA family ATPase [Chlamydiota bacterium]MBI3265643.1 AAA family ATPase [Chlamydiota bacterium]
MIIGLTGRNGSGKGTVAEFLKQKGFIYTSLSDVIREEMKERSIPITRENLIRIGNELRTQGGPSVLADKILTQLDHDKNYAVDSIRNPHEAKALKARRDFILAYVDAALETRFERIKARGRENDPQTLEEFIRLENLERNSKNPTSQQLDETQALADIVIQNNGTLDVLNEQIIQILKQHGSRTSRPGWDDYFMGIAKVVALRSNCIKRKVAAVIVKDKRIISTGYNGTPRGVKNCMDGGCPRCNSFAPSGTLLEECLCSHAEENAITQSAYHGVTIKDSTIYSTFSPCLMCTKMIINSGIREVIYSHDYSLGEVSLKLLEEAHVKVKKL